MKLVLLLALILASAIAAPVTKELIDHVNKVQNGWVAGVNFDGAEVDTKYFMGTYLNTPAYMKQPYVVLPPIEADIPDTFDSRVAWPNCQSIKEVRDQANCGSCWAEAATEAMSDRICIASKQTLQTRISVENLLSCCSACGDGCHGGHPAAAWSYWCNTGIVTGDAKGGKGCQPYFLPACARSCPHDLADTPACSSQCQSSYDVSYDDDLQFGSTSYSVPADVRKIQQEIMTNGPVEAAFSVYTDLMAYKSGVYSHVTGDFEGGHAIKIIGWGVEGGKPYWLIVNSWNTVWGEKGLFKMLRGSDECGIESQIVAGLPQLN